MPDRLAAHDQLRPLIGLRLDQHRIHINARRNAAGERLQRLRPSDLAAISGHRRVIAHILRLERRHTQTAPSQETAKPGHQHRLADTGGRALNHQRLMAQKRRLIRHLLAVTLRRIAVFTHHALHRDRGAPTLSL